MMIQMADQIHNSLTVTGERQKQFIRIKVISKFLCV